jgi:hypothetical protein
VIGNRRERCRAIEPTGIGVVAEHVIGVSATEDWIEEPAIGVAVEPTGCLDVGRIRRSSLDGRQVQCDTDVCMRGDLSDRPHRKPVPEQEVMRRADRRGCVVVTRRLVTVEVAAFGDDPWFVDRDPPIDSIAQPICHDPRVRCERQRRVARRPPTSILESLRQIPVIQRHPRLDPALEEPVHQPVVEVETGWVHRTVPTRQHPRPGDRESIRAEPQFGHEVDITLPESVVITGNVAAAAVLDHAGSLCEGIPDRHPLAIRPRRSFDLVRRRGRTPHKARWEEMVGHGEDTRHETRDTRSNDGSPKPVSVSCLTSRVSRLVSHVSCLTSRVSRLVSHVSRVLPAR